MYNMLTRSSSGTTFDTLFAWNAVFNFGCLTVFLLGRQNTTLVQFYHISKYAWAIQYLILFNVWKESDDHNIWPLVAITYGFGMDYFILLPFATGARAATLQYDILVRAATNLCHHLWIFTARPSASGSYLQAALCVVGWSIHLYPWFQYMHQMLLFKILCQVGNLTPLLGLVAWWFWYDKDNLQGKDVHAAILFQLFVYRTLYSSCYFHVFSKTIGGVSMKLEAQLGRVLKHVSLVVSIAVAVYLSQLCPG